MFEGEKAVAVFQGGSGIVDRAGTDDDEEAMQGVGVLDYRDRFVTRL